MKKIHVRLQDGRYRKSTVRISKFFLEGIKDQSKIVFQVIFHIDGDFNNSMRLKDTFLDSSYKAIIKIPI